MSNLVDYAKDELKRIGMIDSGESYNDWATKTILDLIELFSSQGHSGFTASYVINAFNRLARFKPLSPLTGEADEWNDTGHGLLQNKRYSAVFKDEDGIAYNSEGRVFSDDGEIWYTCKDSKVNVTFPYVVPDKPEYVYRNAESEDKISSKSLCDSCITDGCIFQSEIVRKNCDFYKSGRWIEERTYMECPNCHDIWHYEKNQTERFKFCPTCGKRGKR